MLMLITKITWLPSWTTAIRFAKTWMNGKAGIRMPARLLSMSLARVFDHEVNDDHDRPSIYPALVPAPDNGRGLEWE